MNRNHWLIMIIAHIAFSLSKKFTHMVITSLRLTVTGRRYCDLTRAILLPNGQGNLATH